MTAASFLEQPLEVEGLSQPQVVVKVSKRMRVQRAEGV